MAIEDGFFNQSKSLKHLDLDYFCIASPVGCTAASDEHVPLVRHASFALCCAGTKQNTTTIEKEIGDGDDNGCQRCEVDCLEADLPFTPYPSDQLRMARSLASMAASKPPCLYVERGNRTRARRRESSAKQHLGVERQGVN